MSGGITQFFNYWNWTVWGAQYEPYTSNDATANHRVSDSVWGEVKHNYSCKTTEHKKENSWNASQG